MSRYLIRRIDETSNITLHTNTEIASLEGDGQLERVVWKTAAAMSRDARHRPRLSMTGAVPARTG